MTDKASSKRGSIKSNSKKSSVAGFGVVNPNLGTQDPANDNKTHKTLSNKSEETEEKNSLQDNNNDIDKSLEVRAKVLRVIGI